MVERIQSLLAKFPEDEETVRRLAATDARFNALCDEYRKIIDLLATCASQVRRLREHRALLEDELLTRIEGHQPL
ncbi:hypothetical protein [Sinorhizobium sp. Sb3]|uniref:hypothetical protein n=1 Tax=Sinorhizobium/Ensifer group TaxID=227292 RepID=UPI00071DC12D|nr:hypothetical protein [Sinorhizobium sp. Sb3]KSV71547.1 hypothetical protein N183_27700 [Sinorhizobium sp. Sb3]